MQIEDKPENLMTLIEEYLDNPNYNHYPDLDLFIMGNEQLGDRYYNSIQSYTLWSYIAEKLEIREEDIDNDPLFWDRFAGT